MKCLDKKCDGELTLLKAKELSERYYIIDLYCVKCNTVYQMTQVPIKFIT